MASCEYHSLASHFRLLLHNDYAGGFIQLGALRRDLLSGLIRFGEICLAGVPYPSL